MKKLALNYLPRDIVLRRKQGFFVPMHAWIKDNLEDIWDHDKMFEKLRTREHLKSFDVGRHSVGCGKCEDKYICGGCRARSYSYFNGDLDGPDVGCIDNKEIWDRIASKVLRTSIES